MTPEHYLATSVQPVEVWDALGIFREAVVSNIIKYVMRAPHRGEAKKDLKKALHYLDMLASKPRKNNIKFLRCDPTFLEGLPSDVKEIIEMTDGLVEANPRIIQEARVLLTEMYEEANDNSSR